MAYSTMPGAVECHRSGAQRRRWRRGGIVVVCIGSGTQSNILCQAFITIEPFFWLTRTPYHEKYFDSVANDENTWAMPATCQKGLKVGEHRPLIMAHENATLIGSDAKNLYIRFAFDLP
jgi:hypothetical protein